TYNMIVMKTFLQSIPASLEESAMIDGANDLTVLFRIILPLSLPSLATITLFYAVGHWNSYFNVMLYISKSNLKTLQQVLRDLINNSSVTDMLLNASRDSSDFQVRVTQESIKAASIVIATFPIMCVYPFLQKYFVKGVMIGSVKG
nr:carbohydrate ABC transporter permease [Clostridia bacterium]